jgi:hypothetical protein
LVVRLLRNRVWVVVVLLVVVVAGCGDGSGGDEVGDGVSGTEATSGGDSGGLVAGGEIPDFFPSDISLPEGLSVGAVTRDPTTGNMALSGTFEDGDVDSIRADMIAGLEAAGYENLPTSEDIAVFIKNGVGRVRVRVSEFLGELTLSIDIDNWTNEQLDELRALSAEEVVVSGRATAEVGDETLEAEGECTLKGTNRSFLAGDISITLQIDETQDPVYVYADVTRPDGRVFATEFGAELDYDSSPEQLSASGEMVEFNNEGAGTVPFTVTASCDT